MRQEEVNRQQRLREFLASQESLKRQQEKAEKDRQAEILRQSQVSQKQEADKEKLNELLIARQQKIREPEQIEDERQQAQILHEKEQKAQLATEISQRHKEEEKQQEEAKVQVDAINKEIEKSSGSASIFDSVPKPVRVEVEEQSKEKYIGYNPLNIFAQSEPLNYPYVVMPKPDCVIKFPRKGRTGRKGYKEDDFKTYIEKYFKNDFQVFDDRFILTKNSSNPFEPDLTLIDERNGINLFIDIEIDEPYEGINDVEKRKSTHFQYSDTNRNNAFKVRGWIVIRFAEIQVHEKPASCCRFIADVIKSINPKYEVQSVLAKVDRVEATRQWTQEEAQTWSKAKYRENYLGIRQFGNTGNKQLLEVLETEIGEKIEEKITDEKLFVPSPKPVTQVKNPKLVIIDSVITKSGYLTFAYQGSTTVVKPIKVIDSDLHAFCYVKNIGKVFDIYEMSDLNAKENYFTLRVAGPTIGIDKISNAVSTAINYKKHIRMKYTRASWNQMGVDPLTGELIMNRTEAEESIRTINNVQLSINALAEDQINAYNLNSNHITAYCNKREEQRTFRFDRIGQIEILDL